MTAKALKASPSIGFNGALLVSLLFHGLLLATLYYSKTLDALFIKNKLLFEYFNSTNL